MTNYQGKSFTDCKQTLDILNFAYATDIWKQSWNFSNKYQPDEFSFFEEQFIKEQADWLEFSDEILSAFLKARQMFIENPAMQRLFWHCYALLFVSNSDIAPNIHRWPVIPEQMCAYPDMFYAFVFLAGVPVIRNVHREKMIPESISKDTLSDFGLWINEHHRRTGRWGFSQLSWLVNHFSCELFKLGRLQFQFHRCDFDIYAFRNKKSSATIVLPPDKAKFRADGQYDGTNDIFDEENSWIAHFSQTKDVVTGNFISPFGKAEKKEIKLSKPDWQLVLQKGDPVLAVHIPATGPMKHELCGQSFKQALNFFPEYFPGYKFRAFTCVSWLLDSQLEQYLPDESNLIKFLREFYLLPIPNADDNQTFERVFGKKYDNIEDAPRKTSLQRAIIEHCQKGGHWRSTGMIYLPDDVRFWGQTVYRTQLQNGKLIDIKADSD